MKKKLSKLKKTKKKINFYWVTNIEDLQGCSLQWQEVPLALKPPLLILWWSVDSTQRELKTELKLK